MKYEEVVKRLEEMREFAGNNCISAWEEALRKTLEIMKRLEPKKETPAKVETP